jgi:hypothetical protein
MARSWLLLALLPLAKPTHTRQQVPYSYQGTVQAVRRQAGEVDLLTGVGEALRVLHLRIVPATRITSEGGPATVADILPGDLIHADCRQTPQGLVADRVEKLGRVDSLPPRGGSHP